MIRLVLADDQTLLREGLRAIVDAQPDLEVVGEAGDGAEAAVLARRLTPDVVVMDVRMTPVDGIEGTRRIAASGSRSRVLVLTTFDLDEYVFGALAAGASGFVLKDAPRDQLLFAVRAVARGDLLLAPSVTRRLVEAHVTRAPARQPARLDLLSPREHDVFVLMAQGLANSEIADTLVLSITTVKTHVASILAKLGLRDRVQAVIAAYEAGVVRPGGR